MKHNFSRRGSRFQVGPKEKRTRDGILFASQKEARRYDDLMLLRKAGEVELVLLQTPVHFPGGGKYVMDFLVFWADGSVTFEDVKSVATRTESYRFKKRLVKETHGIEITEP